MLQLLKRYVETRAAERNEAVEHAGAKSTQNIKMDISDDYLFIVKYSFKIMNMFKRIKALKRKLHHKENRIFKNIEKKMKKLSQEITNDSANSKFDDIVALAMTYYNFASMYQHFGNLFVAEKYLIQCIELLKGRELDPKAIVLVIEAYLELSYIWRAVPNLEKYYTILIKALQIYSNYTKVEGYYDPIIIVNVLGIFEKKENKDPRFSLDLLHSTILILLEQLYKSNPKDKHEYARYLYDFLCNYLINIFCLYEDEIRLASVIIELSQYFIIHNRFFEAKCLLGLAHNMLQAYVKIIISIEKKDMLFDYQQRYATVYVKCMELCATYGISLLNVSKRRLLQNGKDPTLYEVYNLKFKNEFAMFRTCLSIRYNIRETFPNVTDKYLLNFNEAKVMVKYIVNWFKLMEIYYRSHHDFLTVARIAFYISTAYKYLICFEPDRSQHIHWHKQRICVLKNASKILNKQLDTSAKYFYKLIRFELAIVHIMVADIINENLYIKGVKPTEELSVGIYKSLYKSLNSFKKYMECS